ncbi:hypothetical protein RJ640_008352 [Escallonia rubra]|uniref:RBR-type E3 ubiquitin transferase n=1 Tax=Escallonia rubra TaxID=112253 RepID=A0AA88QIF6_9ASTE|nr:hypothetical protein RJ640_008352 [Escallonia rubra]
MEVDDFYFSAFHDQEEIFPISDEKYAEELTLQEALFSSAISSRLPEVSLEREEVGNHPPINSHKEAKRIKETGHSSQVFCDICVDTKPRQEMFRSNTCSHSFCQDCISKYVAAKLQENMTMIKCPDLNCRGNIGPEDCHSIVPREVFERWENSLCESLILGSQKFYCPFADCSAMLVDDGGEVVTASECPNCRRLFCAQCKVPWHAGIGCREFQGLKKDEREREDVMLMELAKNKKWRRCSNCEYYVEKVDGCVGTNFAMAVEWNGLITMPVDQLVEDRSKFVQDQRRQRKRYINKVNLKT